jgi:hypothetical protein
MIFKAPALLPVVRFSPCQPGDESRTAISSSANCVMLSSPGRRQLCTVADIELFEGTVETQFHGGDADA